ncbi:TonB-dependent siderophore receptor [Mucilaginibacter gotjawali]
MLHGSPLYAQKTTGIKGWIVTDNDKPAAFVKMFLRRSNRTTLTNRNGFFLLTDLPAGNDTLIIISHGTALRERSILIKKGTLLNLDTIRLISEAIKLQTVKVNGRVSHSYLNKNSFFGEKTEALIVDIPQAISTVSKELIHDKMELTLKDALNDVAGVNQYSGFDEYTIRGFKAENARDIDGLRGYSTTYTSTILVNIERIEVIKGPTATLYGNCDPGGTINMVTKKPLDTSRAAIDIYRGAWNHFRVQGDMTGPLNKSKTLLYRINAGYDNTNSFINQTFAKSYELAPSFSFIPNDKFRVNFNFSVSNIHTVLNQGQPGYEEDNNLNSTPINLTLTQPGDYLRETDVASVISASYKINKNLIFSMGYLNYITRENVAAHGLNNYITPDSVSLYYTTWAYHTVTNTLTNYLTYKFKTGKASHVVLAGYDYVRSSVNLNQQYYELPDQFGPGSGIVGTLSLGSPQYFQMPVNTYRLSDYNSDESDVNSNIYHTQGVYLQDQANVGKVKLLGSLREEFYKADDGSGLNERVFLPRIGIVYPLMPKLNGYASYNKGFDPFEASTSIQVFDAPFKPLTSQLLETGLKGGFFNDRLFASAALYQLKVQNVAVNANNISDPNLFVQQGENRSRGFEVEATGYILSNLSVNFNYANCLAIVSKSDIASQIGSVVENAPRNTSSSWIKYTFSNGVLKGLGISAGHSQVGARNTLDPAIKLPGYLVINGGVRYGLQRYRFALNMNNITNKTYWQGAYNNINKWPGAPRNCMFNLGYSF